MTIPQEPLESIRERARRALRDNDDVRLQSSPDPRGAEPPVGRDPIPPAPEPVPLRREPLVVPESPFRRDPAVVVETAVRRDPLAVESPFRLTAESRLQPNPLSEPAPAPLPTYAPASEPAPAPMPTPAPAPDPGFSSVPQMLEPSETGSLLARRMGAIHVVRELEPRRTCARQRVQELQQRLSQTSTDSIHYPQLLQRLAEAHGELNRLEAQIEEARHIIRSTEWLMELLTDPTRSWGRHPGEEMEKVAR